MITTNTGINGVRLALHMSFASTVLFFLIAFFETVLGREHSKKVKKNYQENDQDKKIPRK